MGTKNNKKTCHKTIETNQSIAENVHNHCFLLTVYTELMKSYNKKTPSNRKIMDET